MALVGLEKLYYAKITEDSASKINYGIPIYLEGVKEIKIAPKVSTTKLYAENKLWQQVSTLSEIEVTVDIADLTNTQLADLLGHTIADEGGIYAKNTDTTPYIALLYVANKSNDEKRYGVLYKGRMELPDDSAVGQEGKVDFQNPTLKATFQPLMFNGMWKYQVDSDDDNCPADIDTTWFSSVIIPSADTTAPTVTVVPVDEATSVSVDTNITWTFSKVIDSNKVTASNFFLVKASDGNLVPGTLSLDSTGKIVTFNPTTNLTAASAYIATCTSNVSDMAGNTLNSLNITNFTTA